MPGANGSKRDQILVAAVRSRHELVVPKTRTIGPHWRILRREDPQVASTMLGTTRLAFPEQLVEITFIARV